MGVAGSFLLSVISPSFIAAKQSESKQAGHVPQLRSSTVLRAGSGQAALTTGQLSHYKMENSKKLINQSGTIAQVIEKYLENLEKLKNSTKQDEEFFYEIEEVIAILKNRLRFKGPIEKDGNVSFLGVYKEDGHRINFIIEYGAKNKENMKVASKNFIDELKAVLGTLRQEPGTFNTGKISILARMPLFALFYAKMDSSFFGIPNIRIASEGEVASFDKFKTSLEQAQEKSSRDRRVNNLAMRKRGEARSSDRKKKVKSNQVNIKHRKSVAQAAVEVLSALHEGTIVDLFMLLLKKAELKLSSEDYYEFITDGFKALERVLNFKTSELEISFGTMEKRVLNLTDLEIKSLHKIAPLVLPNFLAKYFAIILKSDQITDESYYEEIMKAIREHFKEKLKNLKSSSAPIADKIRSFKIFVYDSEDLIESDKRFVLAHFNIDRRGQAQIFLHRRLLWELMLLEESEQERMIQALVNRELKIQSDLLDGIEFELAHQRIREEKDQEALLEFAKKVTRKILEDEPYDELDFGIESEAIQGVQEPWLSSPARRPERELKKELKKLSHLLGYSSILIDEITQFEEVVQSLGEYPDQEAAPKGEPLQTLIEEDHLNNDYKGYSTSIKSYPNMLGPIVSGAIAPSELSKRLIQKILKETTLRRSLQAGLLSLPLKKRIGAIELFSKDGRVFEPDEVNSLLFAFQKELLINRLTDLEQSSRELGEGLFLLTDYFLGEIGKKDEVDKIAIRGTGILARSVASAAIQRKDKARVVAIDLGQEILVKEKGFTKAEIAKLQTEEGIASLKSSNAIKVLNNQDRNKIFTLNAELVVLADENTPIDHLTDSEGNTIPIKTRMVLDLNDGLTPAAEEILKTQVPVIPPLLARIGEMKALSLSSLGKIEFERRIKIGAAKVLTSARELAQADGKSVEDSTLYLKEAAVLASVRGVLELNMEKEVEWIQALLSGKVELQIPLRKSAKNFKGIEPIDFERFLNSLKKKSRVPRDFKGLVQAFQKSENSLALKNLFSLMKKDQPFYYLNYRFILSRILEKLNHPLLNAHPADLDKYLKSLHSFHTTFFQNPEFFLDELKGLDQSLDQFMEEKGKLEDSGIVKASIKAIQALHSGGIVELVLMLLEKHRFIKNKEVFKQTLIEFFLEIDLAFGEEGIQGKALPKKESDSDLPFELVEQFILSLTLDDLISIDMLKKTILSRFLKNYLWNLLSGSHRTIVLQRNEKDYLGYIQERFNENLDLYGIEDIKLVEVKAHDNDDLLQNESTFILAPFFNLENGKAVFYIHKDFLNAIMNLEKDEPEKMIERMVHRELEIYRVLNHPQNKAERELNFDGAHSYILEYAEQLILFEFARNFVANLAQSRPLPITDTIEKYEFYIKPQVLNGMEELLSDPEVIGGIARLSMGNLGGKEIIRIEHDRAYLRIYFKDGTWFSLRLDYHRPGVEVHLAAGEPAERTRTYKFTKMLVNLLSDVFYVREKERMNQEVKEFKKRITQQFEQEQPLSAHPWIEENRKLLSRFGFSDSLLRDIFQFGDLSVYPILLGDKKNQKRYLGYHLALAGSSPVGKIMAGMLALPESDPLVIRAGLEKILIKRALQVGLLHKEIQGNAGRIELSPDIKAGEIDNEEGMPQMNSTFSNELMLGHSVNGDIENRSIARGIVRILKHLFGDEGVEEDLPASPDQKEEPRHIVISELSPLAERIVEMAMNNGYKIIGIGLGQGVVTKKEGFTKEEVSRLIHYRQTNTLEQALQFRPHGIVYQKRQGKDPLLEIACDALILDGEKGEIKSKGKQILDRHGNKIKLKAKSVIEVTDGALLPESIDLLEGEKIQVVPHFLAAIHQVFLDVNLGGELEGERLSLNRTVNESLRKVLTLYRLGRIYPKPGKRSATLKETAVYFAFKGLLIFHLEDDLKFVQRARGNLGGKSPPSSPKNFKIFVQLLRTLQPETAELALTNLLNLMRFKDADLYFNYRLALGNILDLLQHPLISKNVSAYIMYWDTLVVYSMDPIANDPENEEKFQNAKNKKLFLSHLLVERLNLLRSDIENYIETEEKKSTSSALENVTAIQNPDATPPSPVSISGSLVAGVMSLMVGLATFTFQVWFIQNGGAIPSTLSIGTVLVLLYLNAKFSTKHYQWLPVWLEAVLKFYLIVPPMIGFALMAAQVVKIRQAKIKANKVRDGPVEGRQDVSQAELAQIPSFKSHRILQQTRETNIPLKETVENFKSKIESQYKITLIDDLKDSKRIAFVNRENPEELEKNIVHIDLIAFYYLPQYLQKSILRDHELLHLKNNLGEFSAYLRQILNSTQLIFDFLQIPKTLRAILAILLIIGSLGTLNVLHTVGIQSEQRSISIEETQGRNLFLIGMHHKSDEDDLLQKALIKRASQGEIVLGIEGVERDDDREEEFIINAYGVPKGLIFGFEDDFANTYSGVLLNYGYFITGVNEEIAFAKAEIIYDLTQRESFKRAWKNLESRNLSQKVKDLYDQINDYLSKHSNLSLKDLANDFYRSLDQFGDNNSWRELYRALGTELTEEARKLPKELQPNFFWINKYLSDKSFMATYYVVNKISLDWRNKFIFKNMQEVAQIARKRGLDVYFLIGANHIKELSKMFGHSKDEFLRIYPTTDHLPKHFLSSGKDEKNKEEKERIFSFAAFPTRPGGRDPKDQHSFEKIRNEFKQKLQNLVNFMSQSDDFSFKPPDAFVVIGSPYLNTYVEFAASWTEFEQKHGKKIPIVIAGGRGSGTIPLIEKMIKKYGKNVKIPVKGKDGLFFTKLEKAKSDLDVNETDLLRFILMGEGVDGDFIIDEDIPSVNSEANFVNSFSSLEEIVSSIEIPRIAVVTAPPLLMRVKPTAMQVWGRMDRAHWQVLRFKAHDFNVAELNDQDLIELASNLIGYPVSYKEQYPDLRYSNELFGVEKRYEAIGMKAEEETQFKEASSALLMAQESYARFLSGLQLYYDKSVKRLIPTGSSLAKNRDEGLHRFVESLANPSLHGEPMPNNAPVERLDISNLDFHALYDTLNRLRQTLNAPKAEGDIGFIELNFTNFADLWQIFEQLDVVTLFDLIKSDPQAHIVINIKSSDIKAQPTLYNRLQELGVLFFYIKDLDELGEDASDGEEDDPMDHLLLPFNLVHAGAWMAFSVILAGIGFVMPFYLEMSLPLKWLSFMIGFVGSWSGIVIGSHFFLAILVRGLSRTKEPVVINRKLEKYIYDDLTGRMNGENITVWYKSQKEMNRLAAQNNKLEKNVFRKLPLIGNIELTDSEKKAVTLADWLVKESNNRVFNWLRSLLLPMILDHIEDRLKSQSHLKDTLIYVAKPFNLKRNNPVRILKNFKDILSLSNRTLTKNLEEEKIPSAIEQVSRALGQVGSLFKFLLNELQESKVLFVVNIGDLPFSMDGIIRFMEHVDGKKMVALAVVTDNGQLMKKSEVESLLKGRIDVKKLFIIDQPTKGDLTKGPKFSLKEALEKVKKLEIAKDYTLKVIKVNDFWSFEGINAKELLRLVIQVDVVGDIFGQGLKFRSFSELIRSAMDMDHKVLSIRPFTESQ